MKIGARWFQATGITIVSQFVLGLVVTGASIDPISHEVLGFAVLALAAATLVVALFTKLSPRSLVAASGLLVLLVVLQIPLGFAMLGGDSALLSAAHIANALAIVVVAFAGYRAARRWENKPRE